METVVELSSFINSASGVLTKSEVSDLIGYLAREPKAGDVIPGSGGLRKLRWVRQGMGKRGGARVIYYHVDAEGIVYLLLTYPKSARDDLTKDQLNRLKQAMK